MRRTIYLRKSNFKGILFLLGISLIIGGILYSQRLVNTLKDDAAEHIRFKIRVFEEHINNPDSNIDSGFFFNEVIRDPNYPVIYTDSEKQPQSWININPQIDRKSLNNLSLKDSLYLQKKIREMSNENEAIPIMYQGDILGYYYYGNSSVIKKLTILPYLAIGAAGIFILLGYLGFSYIKKSEQRFIWIGMAKETAHQLGTPLSSISGWLELISIDPGMKDNAIVEMQNDLQRLNKVATRFSKIGSKPELVAVPLHDVINNVAHYFRKRLPNQQKKIELNTHFETQPTVHLNEDLFEWVLENLIKNSIDSIANQDGIIEISVSNSADESLVFIDISDNGKGIAPTDKKNIFKPGYSTKQRGWGLGLSLSNRIIREYHGGKLMLKESKPGVGTVFRIILKK